MKFQFYILIHVTNCEVRSTHIHIASNETPINMKIKMC
jgi:hypothetical protein